MELLVLIAVGLSVVFLVAGCDKLQSRRPYVPQEVLAQFDEKLSQSEIKQLVDSLGAVIKDTVPQQNIYVLSYKDKLSPDKMAERLKRIEGIKWAEPNYFYEASLFLEGIAYAQESVDPATSTPSTNPIIVAVIDTGVNPDHPKLAGKVTEGYNFYNHTTDASGSARGTGYHGTASAGRVVDGSGGADIRIMPLQVNDGVSRSLSSSAILNAVYYAVDHGAHVINMSFGSSAYSSFLDQAIQYAHSKGVTLVASAGNDGSSILKYPAAYNNVIAVAAANEDGKLAGFSNFGNYVDLTAPGWRTNLLSYAGETIGNGTSFSAPFIAGMAALLKYYFPGLTPDQIESQLKSLARNIDDLNPSKIGMLGAGFLNTQDVQNLVQKIKEGLFRLQPDRDVTEGEPAVPWLLQGRTGQSSFVLQPDGTVVKQT